MKTLTPGLVVNYVNLDGKSVPATVEEVLGASSARLKIDEQNFALAVYSETGETNTFTTPEAVAPAAKKTAIAPTIKKEVDA